MRDYCHIDRKYRGFEHRDCNINLKNLCKVDFKYLNQEFDNNVLHLVKQKGFYHN